MDDFEEGFKTSGKEGTADVEIETRVGSGAWNVTELLQSHDKSNE